MRRSILIAVSLMMFLGAHTLSYSQNAKGDGNGSMGKPRTISQATVAGDTRVDTHLVGTSDLRPFRLLNTNKMRSEVIASVRVTNGRLEVFIDEVVLQKGARHAMNTLGIKDYATFKTLLRQQLISVSSGRPRFSRLRWPWMCIVYTPQRAICEDYDWIGFTTDSIVPAGYATQQECEEVEKRACKDYTGGGEWHVDVCVRRRQ